MKIYVVCEHLSNVLLYTYTDKYTHTYTEIQTHKKRSKFAGTLMHDSNRNFSVAMLEQF